MQLKLEGPPQNSKADTSNFVDRDDRLPEEANRLNLLAEAYCNAHCRTPKEIAETKEEKKSTQLYNQLNPDRRQDTSKFVDRDDRLPEEANKLNLWADAFCNAGCRTPEEIAETKKQKKSTQLYDQLKPDGRQDTNKFMDRDDRLPEEANKLNLLAEAYCNAHCRTPKETETKEEKKSTQLKSEGLPQKADTSKFVGP
jgi:hypothetical protein